MTRNWFKELGLEKLALDIFPPGVAVPGMESARDVFASAMPGNAGGAALSAGNQLARYDPRLAHFNTFMNRNRQAVPGNAGAGNQLARYDPRLAHFNTFMNRNRQAVPGKLGGLSKLFSKGIGKAVPGKLGWLSKLFPKGSGKAGMIGALIPLGIMLASRLYSGGGEMPDWARNAGLDAGGGSMPDWARGSDLNT